MQVRVVSVAAFWVRVPLSRLGICKLRACQQGGLACAVCRKKENIEMSFTVRTANNVETVVFDMTVAEEAELAARQFELYLNEGRLAIAQTDEGSVQTREFDPQVHSYKFLSALAGG